MATAPLHSLHVSGDTSPAAGRRPSRYDAAVVGAALLLLVAGLIFRAARRIPGYGVESDFISQYAPQARNILHGLPYTYPYHPFGYPALVAGLSRLTGGDLFAAGTLLGVLGAPLLLLASYLLFRRLWTPRLAAAAALVLAPALLPYSAEAATDLPGAAIIQLALAVLLGGRRLGAGRAFGAGLLGAVAYLIRSDGALALLTVAAAALLLERAAPWPRRLRLLAAVAAGAVVGILPSAAYNLATTGRLTTPSAYTQLGLAYTTSADTAVSASNTAVTGLSSVAQVVLAHPLHFIWRYLSRQLLEVPPLVSAGAVGFPGYLFLGAGLVLLLRRRLAPGAALYLGFCAAGYLMLGLLDPLIRYYVFLFPLLFLAVAAGILGSAELGRATLPHPAGRRLDAVLLAAIVLVATAQAVRGVRGELEREPRYLVGMADQLRRLAHPGDLVVSRKPHLAWLAGLPDTNLQAESLPDLMRRSRALGARYLVYTPIEGRLWPVSRPLGSPASAPPGLRPVLHDSATGTIVYEFAAPAEPSR